MPTGRLGRLSGHEGRNATERRAGLETIHIRRPTCRKSRESCQRPQSERRECVSAPPRHWTRHVGKRKPSATLEAQEGGGYRQTGNPQAPAWAGRVADGPAVVGRPGNAGGPKGPWFGCREAGYSGGRFSNSSGGKKGRTEGPEGFTEQREWLLLAAAGPGRSFQSLAREGSRRKPGRRQAGGRRRGLRLRSRRIGQRRVEPLVG